ELDRAPAGEVAVAAVLRRPVTRLAAVLPQQRAELARRGPQTLVLRREVNIDVVVAERGEALAVDLLPTPDPTVELALREAARPFDAHAPGELLHARQRQPVRPLRPTAEATREWSPGEHERRIDGERAERAIDVVGDAERRRTGMR